MKKLDVIEFSESLTDLLSDFIQTKKAQRVSELTLRDYERELNLFVNYSHDSTEYKVLERDILTYLSAIPDTSPARYNHPYQCINAFMNYLVDMDYLVKNPIKANHIHKKKDDGNIKPITEKDIKTLLGCMNKHRYNEYRDYCIALLMLDCGIRTSELTNIKNTDYNPANSTIHISKTTAKTRMNRTVYLSALTNKELKTLIRVKPDEWEDWLFPTDDGKHLTINNLDHQFKKYSERCGVKITPYQLRHTFATLYFKNGGNLFTLQQQMGHSDLRMTKRYTEVDTDTIIKQHELYSPIATMNTIRKVRI